MPKVNPLYGDEDWEKPKIAANVVYNSDTKIFELYMVGEPAFQSDDARKILEELAKYLNKEVDE